MLPSFGQCYESARSAKELAGSNLKGEHAVLSLGLTRTIDLRMLARPLACLEDIFPSLKLKFFRGTALEVGQHPENGDTEIAVAGPLGLTWERFASWPLFEEPFVLVVNKNHRLAKDTCVEIDELA